MALHPSSLARAARGPCLLRNHEQVTLAAGDGVRHQSVWTAGPDDSYQATSWQGPEVVPTGIATDTHDPAESLLGRGFFVDRTAHRGSEALRMYKLVLVAAGSAAGGLLRYALQGWGQALVKGSFPLGTLMVNVLGCLAIGFLNKAFASMLIRPEYRIALTAGVLGGFTTFSAFGWETFALANDGQGLRAIMNLLLSVTLGFAAVLIGYRLAERWLGA